MLRLGFELLVEGLFAFAVASGLFALPMAILTTLVIIRRFRSRVGRSMLAAGGAVVPPESHPSLPNGPPGTLEIEHAIPSPERATAVRAVPLLAEARRRTRRLAALYTVAAVVFSLVLTVGVIPALGFSPSRHIILKLALLYGLFALVHGTPAVLALTVILKRQPRFLLAGVVALIITTWGFEISTGIGLVGLWLMIAGIPAGFVLLLNTRRLRAIGPIVLAQMLLGFDGFSVGVAYATFYVLSAIGPLQFVHESLASLPFFDALERYFIWVWNLPWDQQWDEISTLIAAPSTSCWVSCVAASM